MERDRVGWKENGWDGKEWDGVRKRRDGMGWGGCSCTGMEWASCGHRAGPESHPGGAEVVLCWGEEVLRVLGGCARPCQAVLRVPNGQAMAVPGCARPCQRCQGSQVAEPWPCPLQVLKLLIVAWDRRLIFTIGTSNTTGESDTVVWNEIHHKTEFGSNLTGHGYPDPNYLDNVLAELLAQGVSEATLKD